MTSAESGDPGEADEGDDSAPRYAVVLDYLPHGRADDDRPQYERSPLAYALGETDFRLFELTLTDDADVGIGDRVVVDETADTDRVGSIREIPYEELSNAANAELEYVVAEVVDENETRFIDFFNDAQPITLRLHQLNLLPGIGKKLRNNVLDERKRGPFESFDDLHERVSGLHNPREVLVERILEELREEDLKYKVFVRREETNGAA